MPVVLPSHTIVQTAPVPARAQNIPAVDQFWRESAELALSWPPAKFALSKSKIADEDHLIVTLYEEPLRVWILNEDV
ncbi:hypothetical protein HYPSUDRAFT_49007 [Hypholoma sublateritium FD-334 SS-4]|uniref:Uncharacterized protein n=1 Tax=Hypholoma sublateritium (strain FD-334 SS-4) TaxID=945553 RepID=A0A0D2N629_HYPSF|nr:hypothetical protein HYPSUDRAFT_49007 [Hypholoma sublateritium FD-334 SS-4]